MARAATLSVTTQYYDLTSHDHHTTLITYLVLGVFVTARLEQQLDASDTAVHCRKHQGRLLLLRDGRRGRAGGGQGREGGWGGGWVGSGGVWEWGGAHRRSTDVFNGWTHQRIFCEGIPNGRVSEDEGEGGNE